MRLSLSSCIARILRPGRHQRTTRSSLNCARGRWECDTRARGVLLYFRSVAFTGVEGWSANKRNFVLETDVSEIYDGSLLVGISEIDLTKITNVASWL